MNSSNYVEVTSASLDLQFNTYIYTYLFIYIYIIYIIYIVYNSRNPGHGHSLIKHIGKFIKHEALLIHGLDSLEHDLAANFCLGNPRGPGESNKGRCYDMLYNVVYIYIYVVFLQGNPEKKRTHSNKLIRIGMNWVDSLTFISLNIMFFIFVKLTVSGRK